MHREVAACLFVLCTGCFDTTAEDPPGGQPGAGGRSRSRGDSPAGSQIPAISGGTLVIDADAGRAFVSDPDRGRVVVVSLATRGVRTLDLGSGLEPGRAALDAHGQAHVVLRRTNDVVTVDGDGRETRRLGVCAGPRGIAYDAALDAIHVACIGGELWTFDAGTGEVVRKLQLDADLRDVVVTEGGLLVSRFRSAEVLRLDADGAVVARGAPSGELGAPRVGWRLAPLPGIGVLLAHQRASVRTLEVGEDAEPGGYAPAVPNDCDTSLVNAAVTTFDGATATRVGGATLGPLALPVDAAASPTGHRIAVITVGTEFVTEVPADADTAGCGLPLGGQVYAAPAEPIGVAYWGDTLVVQGREPSVLLVHEPGAQPVTIALGGSEAFHPGHRMFHQPVPAAGLACASCHPEGGEDGHVWGFAPIGPRRTQSLLGGLSDTSPFHWDGDFASLAELVREVFVRRMGSEGVTDEEIASLAAWIDAQPALPRAIEPLAATPGRAAFEKAGCADCHAGAKLTSGGSFDVGTGGKFQVPSLLGLRARAPYLHDGCATTIEERFDDACGGTSHGHPSELSAAELADLVSYLSRL